MVCVMFMNVMLMYVLAAEDGTEEPTVGSADGHVNGGDHGAIHGGKTALQRVLEMEG